MQNDGAGFQLGSASLSRRAFVSALPAAAFALRGIRLPSVPRSAVVRLDVAWVGVLPVGSSGDDVTRGIRLASDEIARAAQLLGGEFRASGAHASSVQGAVAAAHRLLGGGATSLIVAGNGAGVVELAAVAAQRGAIIVNASSSDDALRADCGAHAFHVAASDAMYADALRDWLATKHEEGWVLAQGKAGWSARSGSALAQPLMWHASLESFGALALNQRFKTRFSGQMTSGAWAGWFAAKTLWEAALRADASDASSIAQQLGSDAAQFDGHKGRPLTFRSWDHQLRQPVYVVRTSVSGAVLDITEVPRAIPQDQRTSREVLDQLGAVANDCAAKAGAQ